jgi:hypothetical protein
VGDHVGIPAAVRFASLSVCIILLHLCQDDIVQE